MAQPCHTPANDRKKKICYTDIVYKWIHKGPLIFYNKAGTYKSRRKEVKMKYCPYCGAELPDGAVYFCMECGNAIPAKKQKNVNQERLAEQENQKNNKKPRLGKVRKEAPTAVSKSSKDKEQPTEDGYDGYYDDILPEDEGRLQEGIDKKLICRIASIIGGLLAAIAVCVALMYFL